MSTNQIMKLRGYDVTGANCELQREQPFSTVDTRGRHYGMPITTDNFLTMLKTFADRSGDTADNPVGDILWVTFSKASLFRVMAQEDCEYIRFYFAVPDAGVNEASLALEGLDKQCDPIKKAQILAIAAAMETGDPGVDLETNGSGLGSLLGNDTPPNNEEKGNGGPPIEGGNRNISSFRDFLESLAIEFHDATFQDTISKFYDAARQTDQLTL